MYPFANSTMISSTQLQFFSFFFFFVFFVFFFFVYNLQYIHHFCTLPTHDDTRDRIENNVLTFLPLFNSKNIASGGKSNLCYPSNFYYASLYTDKSQMDVCDNLSTLLYRVHTTVYIYACIKRKQARLIKDVKKRKKKGRKCSQSLMRINQLNDNTCWLT